MSTGAIAWEALKRFGNPSLVEETTVIWVAAIGILINSGTALLFMSGRQADLNIRAAFLHLAADAGISLGVVVAGAAIFYTGWVCIDSIVSLIIVAIIIYGTWGLLRDSVNLALDAVPRGIDLTQVKDYLAGLPTCVDVHALHIWGVSTTEAALTAHLVFNQPIDNDSLLAQTSLDLHNKFGIEHSTLQIEFGDSRFSCRCHLI